MSLENIKFQIKCFPYHDQSKMPGGYVAVEIKDPENRVLFGVCVVRTGCDLAEPCNLYNSANSEVEAVELAYRHANDLPYPRSIFSGKTYSGLAKSTASIWIKKNGLRFESDYLLSIKQHENRGKFEVIGTPHDWGNIECYILK